VEPLALERLHRERRGPRQDPERPNGGQVRLVDLRQPGVQRAERLEL
jgi:hypothetical protein